MVTLHQFEISPFCIKLRRILRFKNIPFEIKEYPLAAGRHIRRFNPTGKLPALEHDGRWIGDSTDIVYYLEQKFPSPPIIPDDPQQRALNHILEDWADESLYFYEMRLRFTLPGNRERNLPRMLAHDTGISKWFLSKVIPGGLMSILNNQGVGRKSPEQLQIDIERHLQAIAGLLPDRQWLLGTETPTLADFSVHAMLECFADADLGQAAIEARPAVVSWMQRLNDLCPD